MRHPAFLPAAAALAAALLSLPLLRSQGNADIRIILEAGERPALAVPDLRGADAAGPLMGTFNTVLNEDLTTSGIFQMRSKSLFPPQVPQQPQDFRSGARASGLALGDWSGPPVNANFLAFGYTAVQGDRIALYGWLYDVRQGDVSSAQVFGKTYFGPLNDEGARKVAHEFAADILKQFGGVSLAGTKVYFTSDRTGNKEIWSMDYDGNNQKPFTILKTITTMPSVSPDASRIAFTSFTRNGPSILVYSLVTGRRQVFYNQAASMNATPDFTPDGRQLLFASTLSGGYSNIYIANADGSNLRALTKIAAVEVEPKVNPRTGNEVVFVSGRSGSAQVYKMNLDGADVVRLTSGEGEAVNPSWSPDGKFIAFSWTRGFAPGNFNIFVMDVATRRLVQLTSGAGRNENPVWAPDGRHLVFTSNRTGTPQVYSMLADGTQLRQLTRQGRNEKPVWSKQSTE